MNKIVNLKMEKGSTGKKVGDPRLAQIMLATPRYRGGSPMTKTPMTVGSIRHEVPLNDDEAERRQRRRNNHLKSVMSPGCHTPRSAAHYPERVGDSGTSSFSNIEIADHYAVCIKLSAENKINSKNAFGLHLIEWMSEVLRKRGELTNFQVAGCTLDASAKIYAGRVDSIYNDAFKMLGGFGRSEAAPDDDNGDGPNQEAPQRQHGRKKVKRSGNPNAQYIEKDTKNLNVNTFDLEFEVDPLFKKISTAIDEEGVDGLLLNQLPIDSDDCRLLMDSCIVPIMEDSESDITTCDNISNDSWMELKGYIESVKGRKICPSFLNFKFNQCSEDNDEWTTLDKFNSNNSEYCPRPNTDYTMLQQPSSHGLTDSEIPSSNPSVNGDYDNDDYQDDYNDQEPPDSIQDPLSSETIIGTCGNKQVLSRIDQNTRQIGGVNSLSNDLYLMENIEISEYSYFKPQVLSTWAGAQHWKLKAIHNNKDDEKLSNKDGGSRKQKQSRRVFRIDFIKSVTQELFKKGKISTILSQAAMDKLNPSLTTLPHDPHTDRLLLYQLFTRPEWKVRRKMITDGAATEEQFGGDVYEYDNPTDNAIYDDGDGDGDCGDVDDIPLGFDGIRKGGDEFISLLSGDHFTGDNLITEPQKVNPIQIDYAKHAKRVDVKKIKSTMWEILSTRSASQGTSSNLPSPISLSSLYSDVVKSSPSIMANEMSVSITLVCLLHLANEKSLSVTDTNDLSDLMISLTEDSPIN